MVLCGVACVWNCDRSHAAVVDKPNIVVLFVDDLGWADIRHQHERFDIPNIDQLLADGMTFPNAYAASPTCSPSRAALITGQHPARLKLVRHIPPGDKLGRHEQEFNLLAADPAQFPSRNWLPLEEITYAEALRTLGYRNMFVGKWHLGHDPYHPIHQGFDQQFGVSNQGHPKGYYPPFFPPGWMEYSQLPSGKYLTDAITDDAVQVIQEHRGTQPLQLSVFYYAAHTPYQGRTDLVEKLSYKSLDDRALQHSAMVGAVDESIGRIRRALQASGMAEKTAIFLAGDQGGLLDNSPLRGGKQGGQALYEGGARVPFVCVWPNVASPGVLNQELVVTTDLFPTLLEMAGGAADDYPHVDGLSLVGLLRQEHGLQRDSIFLYRSYEDQYASVRSGNWKLIAYRSGRKELYDLEQDPFEREDLSTTQTKVVDKLTATLKDWEQKTGVLRP
jgi:arylsulfatase A-like enzyme